MKPRHLNWEYFLKYTDQAADSKGATSTYFTEAMKQEVLQKVQQNDLQRLPHASKNRKLHRKRSNWFKPAATGLCMMFLGLVVLFFSGLNGEAGWKEALKPITGSGWFDGWNGNKTLYSWSFQPLELKQKQPGQLDNAIGVPDILPGLINKFNPFQKNNKESKVISEEDIIILDEVYVAGFGRILHYKLAKEDSVEPDGPLANTLTYTGFVLEDDLENDEDDNDDKDASRITQDNTMSNGINHNTEKNTSIEKENKMHNNVVNYGVANLIAGSQSMTELFGEKVLKLYLPLCFKDGDACTFYIKQEGATVDNFATFFARSQEEDVDGDGQAEAVISTYKQNQIYILRKNGDQFEFSSIRSILKAEEGDQIAFDPQQQLFFLTSIADGYTRSFTYSQKGLKELQ